MALSQKLSHTKNLSLLVAVAIVGGGMFLFMGTVDAANSCTIYGNWGSCADLDPPCGTFEGEFCSGDICYYEDGSQNCPADSGSCGPGEQWSQTYYTCKSPSEGGGCRENTEGGDCAAANRWSDSDPLETREVDGGLCQSQDQKKQYYTEGTCNDLGETAECNFDFEADSRWVDVGGPQDVPPNEDPYNDCAANQCTQTGQCNGSGGCQVPAADTDPNDYCDSLSCSSYYWGWDGNTCYRRANIGDNSCEGNGTCYDSADLCPLQGQGAAQTTCANPDTSTCSGTTAGACLTLDSSLSASPDSGEAPLNNVQMTVTVSGTASGDYQLELSCDNGGAEPDTAFFTPGDQDGTYTFATECDYASAGTYNPSVRVGRQGLEDTASTTVTVEPPPDSDPPAVSVAWDGAGSPDPTITWRNTNATATISCSDASGCEGSTNWEYSTPTSNPGSCSGIGGWASYSGSGITITDHRWVCARARDTAGNLGYSPPVEFKVDKTAPSTPTINSPGAADWQDGGFWVDVTDNPDSGGSGLSSCTYSIKDITRNEWPDVDTSRTCNSSTSFWVSVGSTNDCQSQGVNECYVSVKAQDAAGNTSLISWRHFDIDYENPSVGTVSPTSAFVNESVTFTASVSDSGSDIADCDLFVDGGAVENMSLSGSPVSSASGSHTFSSTGTYSVNAQCADGAGNGRAGSPASVSVTAPSLSSPLPTSNWQRLWYEDPELNNFSDNSYLGQNTLASTTFDINFNTCCGGVVGEGRSNDIGFRMGRRIFFSSTDLYRFTVGSDDGVRLKIDGATVINQWGDGGYRTSSTDQSLSGGQYHDFVIEYYEDGGDARVSFNYDPAPRCSPPTGLECGVTENTIGATWSDVSGITNYKIEWREDGTASWSSATTPVSEQTIEGLTPDTTYNVKVRGETDDNSQCNAPTSDSSTINCSTLDCAKTASLPPETFSVPRSGGGSCTVSIEHFAENTTDSTSASYEITDSGFGLFLEPTANYKRIEIDDAPAGAGGDCDLDLDVINYWYSDQDNVLTMRSELQEERKNDDMRYGYKLSSSDCVFQAASFGGVCGAEPGELPCVDPDISGDRRSVNALQPHKESGPSKRIVDAKFDYTLVECTSDSHCTVPGKTKCNLGDTDSFPQNTCIDSERPVTVIETEANFNPIPPLKPTTSERWLRARSYQVFIADSDAEALDASKCTYSVYDAGVGDFTVEGASRACNSEVTITVGSGGQCGNNPDISGCWVYAYSVDRAGNSSLIDVETPGKGRRFLRIDVKPPTAR